MQKDMFEDYYFLINLWLTRIANWVAVNDSSSSVGPHHTIIKEAEMIEEFPEVYHQTTIEKPHEEEVVDYPRLVDLAVEKLHKSKSVQSTFQGMEFFLMQPSPIYSPQERKKYSKNRSLFYYQFYKHCSFDVLVMATSK